MFILQPHITLITIQWSECWYLFPFHRWMNWRLEMFSNSLKLRGTYRTGTQTQATLSIEVHSLSPHGPVWWGQGASWSEFLQTYAYLWLLCYQEPQDQIGAINIRAVGDLCSLSYSGRLWNRVRTSICAWVEKKSSIRSVILLIKMHDLCTELQFISCMFAFVLFLRTS